MVGDQEPGKEGEGAEEVDGVPLHLVAGQASPVRGHHLCPPVPP